MDAIAPKTFSPGAASEICDPGVREGGALARHRGRGDGEPESALALRAGRLERRGRILDRVALLVLVPGRRDEQDVLLRRILDGSLLEGRGALAADAEVDDLGAVVDRIDDRGRLVDVAEAAVRAARP